MEAVAAQSPGHECTLLGLCRKPAALVGQQVQPGPRVGSPWAFRAPSGPPVAVWVAGKGTADEWWCVKALSRIALPRLVPDKDDLELSRSCHAPRFTKIGVHS